MANNQKGFVDEYIDLTSTGKQTISLIEQIKTVEAALAKLSESKFNLNLAVKTSDIVAGVDAANHGLDDFKTKTKETIVVIDALADAERKLKKDILETTLEQKKQALEAAKGREEARKKTVEEKEAAAAEKQRTADAAAAEKRKTDLAIAESNERIAQLKKERDERDAAAKKLEEIENAAYQEGAKQRNKERIEKQLAYQKEKEERDAIATQLLKEANERRAIEQANKASDHVNSGAKIEAADIDRLSESYNGLVEASIKNQLESQKLVAQRKALNAAFKEGVITEDQYVLGLQEVKVAQLRVSQSGRDINLSLNNLSKGVNAATGSLVQLRSQLNLAYQAYDHLGDEIKRSDIGKDLLKQITLLKNNIQAQEDATGRFQRNVGNYSGALREVGLSFNSLATAALAGLGINTLSGFISDAIDEFNQAEQAATKFKGILDNVGRADVLERMTLSADNLAKSLGYLDNDDVIQTFQRLVTYGKLTENQIRDLTPVIIDFAAKQGVSLEDASGVIIKAMEGNGRALKEYGIDMKDAETTTEAFGLIMTELKPKVDGAAKAFGETLAGSAAKSKQEIADLKEEIGGKLEPVVRNFYSFISAAITGIPQLFEGIVTRTKNAISTFTGILGTYKDLAGDVLTLDFRGAANRIAGIKTEYAEKLKLKALDEERATSQREIDNLIKDVSSKSSRDRDKIISDNIAITNAAQSSYDRLKKAGKEFTEEGKAAGKELKHNVDISTALLKAFDGVDQSNVVIGGGNPNKPRTEKKDKAAKKPEDFTNDILSAQDKERKAIEEYNKLIIAMDVAKQERILTNEKNSLDERLDALDSYMMDRHDAIMIDEKSELEGIDNRLSKIAEIENKPEKSRTSGEKKLLIEKEALTKQRIVIETKAQAAELALAVDTKNKRLDILKSELTEEEKLRIENYESEKTQDQVAFDKKIEDLNLQLTARRAAVKGGSEKEQLKVEEEFQNKRLFLIEDFNIRTLEKDVEFTEATIRLAKSRGENTTAAEGKLADAKSKLSDLVAEHTKNKGERAKKTAEENLKDTLDTIDKIQGVTNQISGIIGSALDASATKKKNEIQEQIDLLNKRTQTEIDGINASTASEQDKAAKIAIVTARAAAQREQLDLKTRQIEERKARFEKYSQIAAITLAGIKATVAALGSIPYTPANIALSAFTGAIYAAQLAVAIATPIPKYRSGKGAFDDYEGLAVVGDGGKREMRIKPDGTLQLTPDVPTVTHVEARERIHPDANVFISNYNRMATKRRDLSTISIDGNGNLMKNVEKELRAIRQAIVEKPVPRITNTYGGWAVGYDANQRYVEFLNRISL